MMKLVTSHEGVLRMAQRRHDLSRIVRGDLRLIERTCDRHLADRIASSVWVACGAVSKETLAGRFADLDDTLMDLMRTPSMPVIHDVAVSNGVTSLDLLSRLRVDGRLHQLYISDKYARCTYMQRGLIGRVYDSSGSLLQGRAGVVLADPQASWRFFVSRLLFLLLDRVKPTMSQQTVMEISLYTRDLKRALAAGAVKHLEYDVFTTSVNVKFDVVRCMNMITRSYFSPERIAQALWNLRRSLKPSGLLLVGRTLPSGRNDATFFRLLDGCLVPERVVNQGADIVDIATSLAS